MSHPPERAWVSLPHRDRLAAWVVGPQAGVPVVLIAGAGADHRWWCRLVPELCGTVEDRALLAPRGRSLAGTARVVVFDQRGSGESQDITPATSAETTARDAVAVGRALLGDRFGVVGVSMGGMAALQAALFEPEAVSGLCLMATTAGGAGLTLPSDAFLEHAVATGVKSDETSAREAVGFLVGERFRTEEPNIVEWIIADMLEHPTSQVSVDAQANVFLHHDVADRLSEIRVPTLVICGASDQVHPLPNSEFLAEHIAGARLVVVDGVGHAVFMEAPDRVVDELLRLLSR